ncbi:MAG: hypothetical protein U9Q84_01465 [Thermodesulfobacteriota bacterium]|nr:hypothetical protein [Thermodesulfobacteriota bacterium]
MKLGGWKGNIGTNGMNTTLGRRRCTAELKEEIMEITRTVTSDSFDAASTSTIAQMWSAPYRVDAIVYDDRVEMIYKETALCTYNVHLSCSERVFKIVFSCKDGKWYKSERIYGRIIPATEEIYDFN